MTEMYRNLPVDPALQRLVREIRIQDVARDPVDRVPYTILPGPFPVMGFRLTGALRVLHGAGAELLAAGGVTGIQDGPRQYLPEASTRSVLVTLRPEGAFALFGVATDELLNRELALDHLLPASVVRAAEDRVATAPRDEEVGAAIGALLRAAHGRARVSVHPIVAAVVSAILDSHGSVRIEQLAHDVGISRRQLERLFRLSVGITPKRLASLARFSWAAARLGRTSSWSGLALSAGYADQSHFIRAFTALAGTPPARLVASGTATEMSHSFNT